MIKYTIVNGKKIKRPLILISVMLGMFLSAIEATIVATAMPSIVADLGGFSLYSWVFSSYLLTMAATVLIFGKLADRFGRKPIFVIGVIFFLIGSTLSGFSTSIVMLIMSRFVQGLGAGALMPVATTIVGDIYDKNERAKIQGYLSGVWGISAVSGPLLGGFFVDVLDWRYVFWMNIPLGILAMFGIIFFLHENVNKEKRGIDYAGAVWIIVGVSSLIFILVEGGVSIAWGSLKMMGLISVTVIAIIMFLVQQRRAPDPIMPFKIWKYKLIRIANLATLTTGMILIGVASYLPTFVQGVMGKTATVAGFTLTMMSIGWPLASIIAGRLLLIIGSRKTSLTGGLFLIIGSIFFTLLSGENGPVWAGTGSFFIGVGMGMTSTSFIVAIQNVVGWRDRGIATASNMFMRSLGSAIGVAFLGGLLNNKIKIQIETEGLGKSISVDAVNELLDPNQNSLLPEYVKEVLQNGLTLGLQVVYNGLLYLAIFTFILIYFLPKMDNELGE